MFQIWSISHVTILSTDAGHRTPDIGDRRPDTSSDFIILSNAMHCIGRTTSRM